MIHAAKPSTTSAPVDHGRRSLLGSALAGAGLAGCSTPDRSRAPAEDGVAWQREVDIVVVGAGAAGLPAAIAARDLGASVLVVEQNFDIGGQAMISGGGCYLGGGTSLQRSQGIDDNPDKVFRDWTRADHPLGRWNDREIVRKYADECVATFDFLSANGVQWQPLGAPSRLDSVPRRPFAKEWPTSSEVVVPGQAGSGIQRPLEKSARAKGVEFLLLHRMVELHREGRRSGRILGITAREVDRHFRPLQSTLRIRARKGVILAAGGIGNNVHLRRVFDPRLTAEYQVHGDGWALRTGDAHVLGMEVGGALWGTANQTNEADGQLSKGRLAVRSNYHGLSFAPSSPNFFREKATGLVVKDPQNIVLVKENGRRFFSESASGRDHRYFAAAMDWTGDPRKLNGGGPIWAIFDSAAAAREQWQVQPPFVDPEGYFFQADTLVELAAKLKANPYQWRAMPGDALAATIERYNGFVAAGKDADFNKPTPKFRIGKPPFFAAWATPCVHDTFVGLRTTTNAEVQDIDGHVIAGLYAAGECRGGFGMHGLGPAQVFGRIAGVHAAGGRTAQIAEQVRARAHLAEQQWKQWAY